MASDAQRYWFPAKRYGWGWGPPGTWEGWTALLSFLGIITLAVLLGQGAAWTWLVIVAATLVLMVVCVKKGEPARWRWGGVK